MQTKLLYNYKSADTELSARLSGLERKLSFGETENLEDKVGAAVENAMSVEIAAREAADERFTEQLAAMQDEIDQVERSYDGCEDISLVGVQVTMSQLGKGTVIEQDMNRIKVAFEGLEKTYILDKKFIARPKFENDEEVVSAFTVYARARERISFLETQIASLEK